MKLKAISGMMLALVLVGMLALALETELVSAIVPPEPEYPAIYVDPPVIEGITPGNNFTVSIKANYTELISAYQFTLSYNATIIHGVNVTNGEILTEDTMTVFIAGAFNNTEGTLSLTVAFTFIVSPPPLPCFGPGTLANVTFMVVGYGVSDVILGPETGLWGWPPPWEEPPIIIDAKTMPDHIGHGFFSNKILSDIRGPENPSGSGLYPPDGKVDLWDLGFIGLAYGKTSEDPDWDHWKIADIRGHDGVVDMWDLGYCGLEYGKSIY